MLRNLLGSIIFVAVMLYASGFIKHHERSIISSSTSLYSFPSLLSLQRFDKSLELVYRKSLRIKCPFLRRRAMDVIDNFALISRFVLARHKSIITIPGSCYSFSNAKIPGLSLGKLAEIIEGDWHANYFSNGNSEGKYSQPPWGDGKGYYITGKLSDYIYKNDCVFDGTDPDLPVTGLRKYLSAASQLFDRKDSRAELTCPLFIDYDMNTITAIWRLEGVLHLPWHPKIKPMTGRTIYYVGSDGLIYKHEESWDISMLDAFLSVILPSQQLGKEPALPASELYEKWIDQQII